ncbi:hypothetical protein P691DRAFT_810955 [Macrolepiota fuliginosa MF-IS2]|uniref:F-box domain-containing protein n=1 Tax=Macrolepiota fuliginosa MF-IS2 TaxID=1400762 RepID=A0A9P6C323_9AGAR|nr:hypothetical protein P691DRAFT_810955 [Macrolepiota fuliginosa MF-IS2]
MTKRVSLKGVSSVFVNKALWRILQDTSKKASRSNPHSRAKSVKNSTLMITSLPYDIIYEIALNLDCPSISALRLTCKTFYDFTKIRQIWYGFIRDLRGEHGAFTGGELGTYTLEELERWVSLRQRARDVWGGERATHFRTRVATFPTSTLGLCEFLPGGRWLILSSLRNLYGFDLDSRARAPEPEILVARTQGIVKYSKPWVDRSSDRLTVRVAAWVQPPGEVYLMLLQNHRSVNLIDSRPTGGCSRA